MNADQHDAGFIEFCDEEPASPALDETARWRILIVDDDESVHRSVAFALRDMLFLDRKLEFLDEAYPG